MIDDLTKEKMRVMKGYLDEAISVEDYDEAKKIKGSLDRLRGIGKRIYELEFQKKFYINNEDFDNAKIMKMEIERLKSVVKYIDKQAASLAPIQDIYELTNELDDNKENKEALGNTNLNQSMNKSNYDVINK
jgi:hypothetical protein